MTASLSLQDARYATADRMNRLFEQTLARLAEVPGVQSAAVCLTLPYERALNVGGKWVHAKSGSRGRYRPSTRRTSRPAYFDTFRIPLVRGRYLNEADRATTEPVIVVNQAFVRRNSPLEDPIGRQIGPGTPRRIVGVVGDIQQKAGWGNFGPVNAMPAAYIPATQVSDNMVTMVHTWFAPSWVVRTAGPLQGVVPAMTRSIEQVDPQLPFAKFRTIDDVRGEAVATPRAQAVLLGSLAGTRAALVGDRSLRSGGELGRRAHARAGHSHGARRDACRDGAGRCVARRCVWGARARGRTRACAHRQLSAAASGVGCDGGGPGYVRPLRPPLFSSSQRSRPSCPRCGSLKLNPIRALRQA